MFRSVSSVITSKPSERCNMLSVVLVVSSYAFTSMNYSCMCQARVHANETCNYVWCARVNQTAHVHFMQTLSHMTAELCLMCTCMQ